MESYGSLEKRSYSIEKSINNFSHEEKCKANTKEKRKNIENIEKNIYITTSKNTTTSKDSENLKLEILGKK